MVNGCYESKRQCMTRCKINPTAHLHDDGQSHRDSRNDNGQAGQQVVSEFAIRELVLSKALHQEDDENIQQRGTDDDLHREKHALFEDGHLYEGIIWVD